MSKVTMSQIEALIRKAESGADWAHICELEAIYLAQSK